MDRVLEKKKLMAQYLKSLGIGKDFSILLATMLKEEMEINAMMDYLMAHNNATEDQIMQAAKTIINGWTYMKKNNLERLSSH